jgi:hypothetical protein
MKWKGKINFELRPQLNGSNLLLTEGAGEISAVTEKTSPVSADVVLIEDSAASNAKKRAQLSNIRKINVQDEGSNVANTPHTTLNFVGSPVTVTDGGSGVATITMIFGQFFSQTSSDGESTTTSTTYQQKLRLTYNAPSNATYRIGWYAELNEPETGIFSNRLCLGRVQVDDTTTLAEVQVGATRDIWEVFSGFALVALTSGNHDIDIDYASNESGTVGIRRARIEVWRQ